MKQKKHDILGAKLEDLLDDKEGETIELDASAETPDIDSTESKDIQSTRSAVIVEDIEILHSFIEESSDHLENIEEKILRLEKDQDPKIIDDIFRSMHTMKGTSSFFGFDQIKELSHSLESLLDDLRGGKGVLSEEIIDALLAGTDTLRQMVAELSRHAEGDAADGAQILIPPTILDTQSIIRRISELRERQAGAPASDEASTAAKRSERHAGAAEEEEPEDELITDEIRASFINESVDLLDVAEEFILKLETAPHDKDALGGAFRCIHTMKGNSGFLGFAEFEVICMELETVLDAIRNGLKEANQHTISIILNTLDSLRKAVVSKGTPDEAGTREGVTSEQQAMEDLAAAYKPLGEILVDMGAISAEEIDKALDLQDRRLGDILVTEGKVSQETVDRALSSQKKAASAVTAEGSTTYGAERKDIRVDMSKLDKLFDLMGELITAEAMVVNNPELQNLELQSFRRAANYLGKITREMQEITMSVRMIPLEGLFNKMRRLVRDLSKRFDKEIHFEVSGQDTEMDRNVIEQIADPLMHIIRNSIDHGIEDEAKRRKSGKTPAGTVHLGARYEGNEIWINVKDDGAGLNRERILAKALERDVLKADGDSMKDEEIWQLIFEPGFSTAEKVSEVSGRGVGMDVVKRNVENLRGKIDIATTSGTGTEITLKIPLTLAIIDGVTARVGTVLYALPLGDILEFHKAKPKELTRTDGKNEVLKLREEIIPVIKVYEFFNTTTEKTEVTDGISIVAQRNGKKAALLVDKIEGYQQIVVKALPEYMGQMKAISGCSILGNGEVTLIIDAGSLMTSRLG